ncbi:MAG: helicase-related protein [Pseudomonadota bacterium]
MPAKLTAVLGPTNTGKTHLAVTRMCGHASGMMGFPLRLLAREVYDRVVAIKGAAQVALVTGEEKIVPPGARYWLATAEAMPTDVQPDFLAIDEVQLAADPERGHVFTDRLLHRRGTAETMLLGAATMAPMIRRLLPDADIDGRPRFSTLAFAGPKKVSRLPRRSALIAFSAEAVYGLAEMLRRQKGGAAVVMGALSPRTRNAQVELYQSGEVDYLVATDAIGMGLNMDIGHVAFAALDKFDGERQRRLTPAEIAQIAGRAGRYQTDGTFGTITLGEGASATAAELQPHEITAVEDHDFKSVRALSWRNARLDWRSLDALVASLMQPPERDDLKRTRRATDEAVLRLLAAEDWVRERATSPARIQRLWSVCSLPDYRKSGAKGHAILAGRMFRHLTDGAGHLPPDWIASELAHLDDVQGGIDALSTRMARARTWTYAAHRPDWLADASHWAGRAREVEDRLSDALHERLRQRFVDRRTSVLMKGLAAGGAHLPLAVDPDGTVAIGGEEIGTLTGFRFRASPDADAGEQKRLMATAERRLGDELARRARTLAAADDDSFALATDGRLPPRILWQGARVARLHKGASVLAPDIRLARALDPLPAALRTRVADRLGRWLAGRIEGELAPLAHLARTAAADDTSPMARGLAVQLVEALGILPKAPLAPLLAAMTQKDRAFLARAGVTIGVAHVFLPALLKPGPTRWRLALWAIGSGLERLPPSPAPGLVSVPSDEGAPSGFYAAAGFAIFGARAVRLDMVERLSRAMHKARKGRAPFVPDPDWLSTLGLDADAFRAVMRALGYRPAGNLDPADTVSKAAASAAVSPPPPTQAFRWHGTNSPRRPRPKPAGSRRHSPFAALAELTGRKG